MNPNKNQDHHFSSFAMGVTIGVVASLLFGTEEGRKLVKEALDAIPDKYKDIPKNILSPEEPHRTPTPIITPEETPHHATFTPETFSEEAPPPPPPLVHPYPPQSV